jgi:nucleoside-diphosphate-sugar epimerase
VIVHDLTAIGAIDPRAFDRDFAPTNRMRTGGTDYLLSAGQAMGVRRFVAQSSGAFVACLCTGGRVKDQKDPLGPRSARELLATPAAIGHLKAAVLDARWTEGVVLRHGAFYWPGTALAPGQEQFEPIRKCKFPLVGDGGAVWSFIHVADAAKATVAEWQPALARTLGARKPLRVPRFIGRLLAGLTGVMMMTELRGASYATARRELGWQPRHLSWPHGDAR